MGKLFTTRRKVVWIRCPKCSRWLYEISSVYAGRCTLYGRKPVRWSNYRREKYA
jgi:hypothetical protein